RGEHRQVLHARKHDDGELGVLGLRGVQPRACEERGRCGQGVAFRDHISLQLLLLLVFNTAHAVTFRRPNAASISRRIFTAASFGSYSTSDHFTAAPSAISRLSLTLC